MLDLDRKKIYIISGIVFVILLIFLYPKLFATKEVKVYFSDQQAEYLVAEKYKVKANGLYNNVINRLIAGPNSQKLGVTIPEKTELIGTKIKGRTIFVDFNQALQKNHWGGSAGEMITVYSIVNTLAAFDGIDKVQILIEGKRVETLVGHLELDKPLSFNENLIND